MKSPRQEKLLIANDGAIYFCPRQGVFISKIHIQNLDTYPHDHCSFNLFPVQVDENRPKVLD
jgi:hypothetical protein